MPCLVCSEPVPAGARFCPSCGAPQLPAPAVDGTEDTRRVVTVVFADVVGFTSLAEHLDPERVKRLIDSVFARLVADLEFHGGVVDKVLGDGIVAVFGTPVAHEDDADRAVRAALAMQDTLRVVRDEQPADDIRMRIGVNTGEVLVGTLAGSDESTVLGDVVNTASRLQELAPAGAVLVGDETRRLCSEVIRLQEFGGFRLRGREQETTVWRAVGVDLATPSRRWASDVAFVGRRSELGVLSAVVDTVLGGRGAVAAVSGEPGIGKTRLVVEALAPLLERHPDTLLLEGTCAPYGETNVWWPLVGDYLAKLGLDRSDHPADARELVGRRLSQFEEFLGSEEDYRRSVELVLHLLGLPSALDELGPLALREAVADGIAREIRRRAERTPVIVWLDDLQWAAPVLLELLESVVRQVAGLRVLVIVTYRPFEESGGEWPPSIDPVLTVRLRLEPLDDRESDTLVGEAAGFQLPEATVGRIIARSGGNPLFLIELSRLAADGTHADDELPGTLRALIASRLDGLTVGQRAVLDNAAIIGSAGRASSLRQFAFELGQTFDAGDLTALVDVGFLVRDGAVWRFRSDVVREVAYHTLTKQARAARHAGVARFLAAHDPGAIDRRAHHSATAAELVAELGPVDGVPDGIGAEAIELLGLAANRWNQQGAHRRALRVIERALALHAEGDDVDRRLRLEHVQTVADLRDGHRARMLAEELLADAIAAGDRTTEGDAERVIGTLDQNDGDLVAARDHLGKAVAIFREIGADDRLGEALRARGFAEMFGGSLAEAAWFLGEAEGQFRRTGSRRGHAWVQQHLAWVAFLAGDHRLAEERLTAAIEAFDELGDRSGRVWSLGLRAYILHFQRRNDEALALSEDLLSDAHQWGDDWGASMMLNLQAAISLWRGDVDDARALAERALVGFRRIDDRFGIIQVHATASRASAALGRIADVDRTTEELLALSDSFGELAYPQLAAAGAAMHIGQGARAVERASSAIARLDTTGANVDEGRVVLAFGHLLGGDADRALAVLLDVDVEGSPFALGARALASVALGDRAAALADVERFEAIASEGDVSYWDRAMCAVAAFVADDRHRERRSAEIRALVASIDDIVVADFASAVLVGCSGATAPGRRLPIGEWASLADRLAAA